MSGKDCFPDHMLQEGPCGPGPEDMDVPMVNLGAIRTHMPPGVEPLPDHFDVLELQEKLRSGDARQQAVVAFTLRASYEALRDGIVACNDLDTHSRMKDVRINVLENKLNASYTVQRRSYEPKIIECLKGAVDPWDAPESLWVEMHATTHEIFEDRSPRKYQYALVQDAYDHPASTHYAVCHRVIERLSTLFPVPTDGMVDPQAVFNAIEVNLKTQGELEEKILKICNVDPADDVTVLDGVQALADLATSLSHENVRLRAELDEARKDGFIHPKRYVRHLEDTLVALGRMLGHKTFPQHGGGLPYDKQMTNYCSRLLQAVRTRMNNINAKKGSK